MHINDEERANTINISALKSGRREKLSGKFVARADERAAAAVSRASAQKNRSLTRRTETRHDLLSF